MKSFILGVDIGGTSIKAGVLDQDNNILVAQNASGTASIEGHDQMRRALYQAISPLLIEHSVNRIGIGSIGPLDCDTGIIYESANIKGIDGFNLKNEIKKLAKEYGTSCDIKINNDGNCAALGHYHFFNEDKFSSIAAFTLGTGIGGGLIVNGSLFNGYKANAFEIGHIPVYIDLLEELNISSKTCGCGHVNCLEAFASATAVGYYYENFTGKRLSAFEIYNAALSADPDAIKAFTICGQALGMAAAIVTQLLNLPLLIFSGGMAAASELFKDPLEETFREHTMPLLHDRVKIIYTEGDVNLGILGAAALFL